MTEQEQEQEQRADYIRGLRELASFLEAHPAVQTPPSTNVNVFVRYKSDITSHARLASWQKRYIGNWFSLAREFPGGITYEINTERENICRKVSKGTRHIEAVPARDVEEFEWVCDDASLLIMTP